MSDSSSSYGSAKIFSSVSESEGSSSSSGSPACGPPFSESQPDVVVTITGGICHYEPEISVPLFGVATTLQTATWQGGPYPPIAYPWDCPSKLVVVRVTCIDGILYFGPFGVVPTDLRLVDGIVTGTYISPPGEDGEYVICVFNGG